MDKKRTRHLLSWREPGGTWTVTENHHGETLTLRSSARDTEISSLDDSTLREIVSVCQAALRHRAEDD